MRHVRTFGAVIEAFEFDGWDVRVDLRVPEDTPVTVKSDNWGTYYIYAARKLVATVM